MKRTRKAARRAVSRRPKRARREYFDAKRNMRDPILREKWNNRKSPQANFANISIGEFEGQLADDEELKKKTPEKKLNEMETKIISKLIEKHQDDYVKMSRDTKINVYQWTAIKCKNLARSFSRGHCCVSSRKYLSHLIAPLNQQQNQQQEHEEKQQQTAGATDEAVASKSRDAKASAADAAADRKAAAVKVKRRGRVS